METSSDAEIFVHVTAPCRAVDDARYRALAQAYLDFNPAIQTKLLSSVYVQSNARTVIPSSQAEPIALQTSFDNAGPVPSSEATQLPTSPLISVYHSPELSFKSVLDNINSPVLQKLPTDPVTLSQSEAPIGLSQTSWQTPPSVVGDSQPLNNISIDEFSSPSRLFEHLAGQFDSQAYGNPRQAPWQAQHQGSSLPEEDEQELEGGGGEESRIEDKDDGQVFLLAPSGSPTVEDEVPDNIVLSTPFPSFKRPPMKDSSFEQIIEDTPCQPPRKRLLTSSPSRAGSEPPPNSKRHKRAAPVSQLRSMARSSSDIGPSITNDMSARYRPKRPPNKRHLSYLERLEIHPAGPPIAVTELTPDDLLTPKLRELAQQLDISRRFHPAEQTRDLRPFERGHWLLNWVGWRPTLRERAWHFLTDYILEGFAGWGVWCARAEDWSWLRVYCWGHVVGHVYLALYLASERALKTDGAMWVDGEGQVVVVTNGHENSESGDSLDDDGWSLEGRVGKGKHSS